ncbi:hypothetical protein BBJ28_00023161, partial [Nothophytophthora sp. Chile5]
MASIAFLQKTRAGTYAQQARKTASQRRPSSNGTAVNGHSHHLTLVQNGRVLADPSDGYELFPIDFTMHAQIRQTVIRKFLEAH